MGSKKHKKHKRERHEGENRATESSLSRSSYRHSWLLFNCSLISSWHRRPPRYVPRFRQYRHAAHCVCNKILNARQIVPTNRTNAICAIVFHLCVSNHARVDSSLLRYQMFSLRLIAFEASPFSATYSSNPAVSAFSNVCSFSLCFI